MSNLNCKMEVIKTAVIISEEVWTVLDFHDFRRWDASVMS